MVMISKIAKMIDHSILNPAMTDEDLIRECAGGVRTLDHLLRMRAAGATRSGATTTEAILLEAMEKFKD